MKRVLISLCLVAASALGTIRLLAACGSYFQAETPDTTFYGTQCVDHFGKISHWRLFFTNGHETHDLQVKADAACFSGNFTACYPGYDTHRSGPTLIPQCGTK